MTRQESMQQCYDDIMQLKGADDAKKKITEIHTFLKDKEPYSLLNTMADFLLVARPGGGIKTVVNTISDYLYIANAIEFCGKVKWFTFELEYVYPEYPFREIERLEDRLSIFKGFNRHYKGVIHIDLDRWIEHTDDTYFDNFLSFLATIDHRILFFFGIHTDNIDYVDKVKSVISQYIRIETLNLRFPDSSDLTDLLESHIQDKRFTLDENAKELLGNIISDIVSKRNFYGFNTIEKLAEDIIYYHLVTCKTNSNVISVDSLFLYTQRSSFIKELLEETNSNNQFGFKRKDDR